MCLKNCVLKILQNIVCCQAALSSSLSTQVFYPQKKVHYLKRKFTNKEEFYNCFPISKLHSLLKCHLNASFKTVFSLCSMLRNVGKDTIVLDRETAATFGRQKEVSSGVCIIHFISWSAQYCSNTEQDSQSTVAFSSHRLPYCCHLANLQSFHVLLQLANHNYQWQFSMWKMSNSLLWLFATWTGKSCVCLLLRSNTSLSESSQVPQLAWTNHIK